MRHATSPLAGRARSARSSPSPRSARLRAACALGALATLSTACPQPPPAPPADASPDASDASDAPDASDPRCEIPQGAPAYVLRAAPRAPLRCVRYPFPLGAPRDVLEARDGAIYVTEQRDGRVVRLTASGFVPVATGLQGPIGLRQADDGTIYLAQEGARTLAALDPATGALRTVATNDRDWTYLALGPDGAAYVSAFTLGDNGTGAVRRARLDDPSAALTDYATDLWVPEALAFRADGALIVAEWGDWNAAGTAHTRVSVLPPGGGSAAAAPVLLHEPLERVYGLVAAPSGGYFVADTAGRVLFTRDGATVDTVLTDVAVPTGMTVTRAGDLLIAEHGTLDHAGTGYLLRVSGF